MQKARLALVAIILLSVAGGAFALKVKRATDKIYVTTTGGANATLTVLGQTLTPPFPGAPAAGLAYATTIFNGVASQVLIPYYAGQ